MLHELSDIFDAAVAAVKPRTMLRRAMALNHSVLTIGPHKLDLERYEHLYLCGAGKAALPMAAECETLLQARIDGGVIVSPEAEEPLHYCTYMHSTHPLPSQESIAAAEALTARFRAAGKHDLILFLLSGGASALIEKPLFPVTLEEMAAATKLLLENGCTIGETNAVRKHLSMIKGGRLARMTEATVVVLVISDVIGDDLQTIGSGPLYCDKSTYAEAAGMLREKGLMARLPQSVRQLLEAGERGTLEETPKTPLPHVTHLLLASNRQALDAAVERAVGAGLKVHLEHRPIRGDVAAAAEGFCRIFDALPPRALLLCGGETTVTVRGNGRGGRNQHFALLCLQRLGNRCTYDIICAGTDGIDGNSDAAGARIGDDLYRRCTPKEIEAALERFDSNTFFTQKEAVIRTGYTGTNVMDIVIAYKGEDNG